jgi:hypothetical protein
VDTSNQDLTADERSVALDRVTWQHFLEEENRIVAETGLRVGIISIDLAGPENEPERDQLLRDRAVRLLRRRLAGTDRIAVTSLSSLAILRAPLESLPSLERQARDLALQLYGAGLQAAIGFAHRRAGEDLMNTWARADAQADRALFRREHPDRGLSLP